MWPVEFGLGDQRRLGSRTLTHRRWRQTLGVVERDVFAEMSKASRQHGLCYSARGV